MIDGINVARGSLKKAGVTACCINVLLVGGGTEALVRGTKRSNRMKTMLMADGGRSDLKSGGLRGRSAETGIACILRHAKYLLALIRACQHETGNST